MKQVHEKEDCCGCTACMSICPKQTIFMKKDTCGFSYPLIDERNCIDCGLCRKICSFIKSNNYENTKHAFVLKHNDFLVVKESRSGGAFTAISDIVLGQDGIVYGAYLDDRKYVRHIRTDTKKDRNLLRKSKYVQSDLQGIFQMIKDDLKIGKYVMFTGTGCQCDGLKGFIEQSHVPDKKLLLCDVVCHSNASPGLFEKYLNYQEKKHKSSIKEFYFRDKEKYDWQNHVEKIVFSNGRVFYTDEYTNLFFSNDIRPSCFKCKYTSLKRCSDLTLADCWGGEKIYPELVDKTGASLMLVNTVKGKEYLEKIREEVTIKEIDIEDIMQPRLKEPAERSQLYETFWYDYNSLEFDDFLKKYSKNNYSIKNCCFRKMKQTMRFPYRVLKKIQR